MKVWRKTIHCATPAPSRPCTTGPPRAYTRDRHPCPVSLRFSPARAAHSPWPRGANENANGALRQCFPSGTNLSIHSPQRLARVQDEFNIRRRKRHAWATPAGRLTALQSPHGLSRCCVVRWNPSHHSGARWVCHSHFTHHARGLDLAAVRRRRSGRWWALNSRRGCQAGRRSSALSTSSSIATAADNALSVGPVQRTGRAWRST